MRASSGDQPFAYSHWPRSVLAAAVLAGCGATTGLSAAPDAAVAPVDVASIDTGRPDVPTPIIDVGMVDLPSVDAGSMDAPAVDIVVVDVVIATDVEGVDDTVDAGPPYVVQMSVAATPYQCAVMSDGTVRCRGSNELGELGIGTSGSPRTDAVTVPGLADAIQVITNDQTPFACALQRSGRVQCWGGDVNGELGNGRAGDALCVVPGNDAELPCRTRPTPVQGLTNVVQLATREFAVCAVRSDGTVWCWGLGDSLLPIGATPHTPQLAPVLNDVATLTPSGASAGWVAGLHSGRYEVFPASVVPTIPEGAALCSGSQDAQHLCWLLPDATIRCQGLDTNGQLGDGTYGRSDVPVNPGLVGVRAVAVGYEDTCALMNDGTVQCWGSNLLGEVSAVSTARSIPTPTPVAGLTDVTAIYLGDGGACAVRMDHSVYCWGSLASTGSGAPTLVQW